MSDLYRVIGILTSIFLFYGCLSKSNLTSFEDVLYPEGRPLVIKVEDEISQQRFNHYFLEACRLKAQNEYGSAALYFMEALRIDSVCATCYYEISQLLIQNREFDDAEKFAFKAVMYDPDNPYFINLLTQLFFHNNKIDLAIQSSQYLVDKAPGKIDYLYQLAQIHYQNKDYNNSIHSLNQIENLIGVNEDLSFEKHSIFLEANDNRSARREIEKLIETYPDNIDYQVFLGDFYLQLKKNKKALSIYNDILNTYPNNGLANFSMSNYYLQISDISKFKEFLFKGFQSEELVAERKIQRLIPFIVNLNEKDNPLNEDDIEQCLNLIIELHKFETIGYVLYGNFLSEIKKEKLAAEMYETALFLDERQEDVWHDFLILIFADQDRKDKIEHSKTAADLFPENAFFNYMAGLSFVFDNDYSSALPYFEQSRDFSDNNKDLKAVVLGLLGDVYFQNNDKDNSFSSYEESLKIDPENLTVLNNYAYYLSLENENLDKAHQMSSLVIQRDPDNPTFLDTYAWVLFKMKKYLDALYYIEIAVDLDEENNSTLFEHYGDILFKNGDVEEALKYWIIASEHVDEASDILLKKIQEKNYISDDEEK